MDGKQGVPLVSEPVFQVGPSKEGEPRVLSVGGPHSDSLLTLSSGEERFAWIWNASMYSLSAFQRGPEGTIPYVTTDYNFKLPGASGKVGARETEDPCKKRLHPKPKFYRKTN